MKALTTIKVATTLALVSTIMFTGCAEKNQYGKLPNQLVQKHKDLPSWVNNDSGLVAIGSATYKGQSYVQQKNQAVSIAKMNLGRKIQTKVDSLVRDYYRSTGAKEAMVEELNSQTTSQVSSQVLQGVYVKEVYVSDDGEMFVQVGIDSETVSEFHSNNTKMQKYIYQQLQAEKSFKELKQEVKEFKDEQNGVAPVVTVTQSVQETK